MDDIRQSFSRFKKDLKYRLTGRKHKVDKTQHGRLGERVDHSGSLPRPKPHVVMGGDREQGNESNADDESSRPSAVANGNKLDEKSTASASAKLVLRGVRDSADAFGPLKSIAGSLCFILENCEVRLPPHTLSTMLIRSRTPQRQINKQ